MEELKEHIGWIGVACVGLVVASELGVFALILWVGICLIANAWYNSLTGF